MVWRPGIWVRGNEHRLLAPSDGQKSTLSIVGIEVESPFLADDGDLGPCGVFETAIAGKPASTEEFIFLNDL